MKNKDRKFKLSTLLDKSLLIEFLIVSLVIVALDVIFTLRFSNTPSKEVRIYWSHFFISFFYALFISSVIGLIRNNKKRFFSYVFYIVAMLILFIADSALFDNKGDFTGIADLFEVGTNTIKMGFSYNPFATYDIFVWIMIALSYSFIIAGLKVIVFRHEHDMFYYKKSALKLNRVFYILAFSILLASSSLFIHRDERKTFKTPQDKTNFVKNFGLNTYHMRDLIGFFNNKLNPYVFHDQYREELDQIIDKNKMADKTSYFNALEDENIIMIMCETCEQYGYNPEITPNYERIKAQGLFFNNFYSAANNYKTYDAEFKALTSMMYFESNNYMYQWGGNQFSQSLPAILKENGYKVNAFHTYESTFFNRQVVHKSLGFENFYGIEHMNQNAFLELYPDYYYPLDTILFEDQDMMDIMAPTDLDQPFFSYFLNFTPHGPHHVDRPELEPYIESLRQTAYYQEVVTFIRESFTTEQEDELVVDEKKVKDLVKRFENITAGQMDFDRGLGILLDRIESNPGLRDNTTIVLFSDHKNYSSLELTQLLTYTDESKMDDPAYLRYEEDKVPFMIYSSNPETRAKLGQGKTSNILTSNYDIAPTMFDLLGVEYVKDYYYGQSMFKATREDLPIIVSHSNWISNAFVVYEGDLLSYKGDLDLNLLSKLETENEKTIEKYRKMFYSNYFADAKNTDLRFDPVLLGIVIIMGIIIFFAFKPRDLISSVIIDKKIRPFYLEKK